MGRVPSIKEVAAALAAGASVDDIAARSGCTPRSVRNVAYRGGLALPQARRRSHRRERLADHEWLRSQLENKSPTVIARELGSHLVDVQAAVETAGIAWVSRRRHAHPRLSDREWLAGQLARRRSLQEIAAEIGSSKSAVRQAAVRHGIEDRRRSGERSFPQLHDPAWLRRRYLDDELSAQAIAGELGCRPGSVLRALRRAGIPVRSPGGAQRRIAELHDPAWLRRRYLDDGHSTAYIAGELDCGPSAVLRALRRAGIPTRPGGGAPRIAELHDPAWLRRRYLDEGHSGREIAAELGCSASTVFGALHRVGVQARRGRRFPPKLRNRAWLAQRYVTDDATTRQIADEVGCRPATVRLALHQAGIPLRSVRRRSPPSAHRLHAQWQQYG